MRSRGQLKVFETSSFAPLSCSNTFSLPIVGPNTAKVAAPYRVASCHPTVSKQDPVFIVGPESSQGAKTEVAPLEGLPGRAICCHELDIAGTECGRRP